MRSSGKRAAAGSSRQPLKKLRRFGTKPTWRNGAAGPSAVHEKVSVSVTGPPLPQHYVHTPALLTNPYTAYGLAGSAPAAIHYEGASAGMYGLSGTPSGNLDPSSLYLPESQAQLSYYDRSLVYGANSLPSQYHATYYPN